MQDFWNQLCGFCMSVYKALQNKCMLNFSLNTVDGNKSSTTWDV